MIITSKATMDLIQQSSVIVVNAVQDDRYSRNLEISMFCGGVAWNLPKDIGVLIRYGKEDGKGGEYDILPDGSTAWSIRENVLTVALAPQVLTAPGVVRLAVILTDGEMQLSTFTVLIYVQPSVHTGIAESEDYYRVTTYLMPPATAEAGQFLRVASVDANGKVNALEATDLERLPGTGMDPEEVKQMVEQCVDAELAGITVPTKLSQLTNDSGFITNAATDLVNYYSKSETYTQQEIDEKISMIPKFRVQVVSELPGSDISDTTIYLLPEGDGVNLYTEYIYTQNKWEILGAQKVDLTDYATHDWVTGQLTGYQPRGNYALSSDIPEVPVESVNGKTGAILLTAEDVGADVSGAAVSAAAAHNVDVSAHSDIREQIEQLYAAQTEPMENDIPKVFFGAALPQTKDDTVMPFRYISKTLDFSGFCVTKAQGSSSMNYPKKNQTVKLYRDADCTEKLNVDFKGWGAQNKFCFKANWIDLTHARNVVSARLWGDMVKSRANYDSIPELLRTSPNQGAVDGFPVKVYAKGVYQGRYTINIPKDAWMANMDDNLDSHCILCGENSVDDRSLFRALPTIDGTDWSDEVHDTVPAAIKTNWNTAVSFVMNSTDDEFKSSLGSYFDVQSLIDYHLYGLLSCGLDAYGKNQLFMTYDGGQKWFASMYDMDSTWGLWWTGDKFVSAGYPRSSYQDISDGGNGNLLFIRLEELFYNELAERWEELKNGVFGVDSIINRFERFTDIVSCDLVAEDYASTTAGGAFTAIPSQSTNNIQQIRAFVVERHNWLNNYLTGIIPEEPGLYSLKDGVYDNGDVCLTITDGSHVRIQTYASHASQVNVSISDYSMNKGTTGWENAYAEKNWFWLHTGDKVVLKRINTIANVIGDSNLKGSIRLVKAWDNTVEITPERPGSELCFDSTVEVTIESDGNVGCMSLWNDWCDSPYDVEFDVRMYVNSVRYI